MKRTLGTVFAAGILALSVTSAFAAAGETVLRLKAIQVEPDVSGDIPGIDVDGATGGEIGFTGFLSDHWALDLGVGTTKHDVKFFNTNSGSLRILPVNLLLQYHFAPNGGIRPYIGAGGNYTHFYDINVTGNLADVDRNVFGPVAQVGLDIPLGKTLLLNLDVKKIWLDTDVSGVVNGNLKLDPWVYGAGLGFRF